MRLSFTIYLSSLFIILALTSCGKDDKVDPPVNAAFAGDFISGAHPTSGLASIDQEETTLTLTNFKTDTGPDLNIYLATSNSNVTSNFIDLGDIKGVDGTYTYDLPGFTDYTLYKYVIVWCVDFDVNFGNALLIKQ
jgi:hypothetical protein